MLHADCASTLPQDWTYVAEGGDTIVLAYVGPPRSDLDRTVLRLKKRPRGKTDPVEQTQLIQDDEIGLIFQQEVIERLLPSSLLPRYGILTANSEWLADLASV